MPVVPAPRKARPLLGRTGTAPLVPLPAIVADIGGTSARFAVVGADGEPSNPTKVAVADHPSLEAALTMALSAAPQRPRSAVFALAGLVRGDRARLTNGSWVADPRSLLADHGLSDVVIVNDFEALALSLPFLAADHLVRVGEGVADPDGTRLVIGPGTGLGAAGLLKVDGRWLPVRGEGGHIDFGPRTARDAELWPYLDRIGGRVSAEWLLSGPGLLRLHRAVARSHGSDADYGASADITAAALAGTDPIAREALDLFAAYLGRYAGDLALVFMPAGGVFIGGSIAPAMAGWLRTSGFRASFADKAPHGAILADLTTAIITHPTPALLGLATLVTDPTRFAVDLSGRRWSR